MAARHPGSSFTCLLLYIAGLLCARGRMRTDETGQGTFSASYFRGGGKGTLLYARSIASHPTEFLSCSWLWQLTWSKASVAQELLLKFPSTHSLLAKPSLCSLFFLTFWSVLSPSPGFFFLLFGPNLQRTKALSFFALHLASLACIGVSQGSSWPFFPFKFVN